MSRGSFSVVCVPFSLFHSCVVLYHVMSFHLFGQIHSYVFYSVFLSVAIVNEIVFLILFSDNSLLACRDANDFVTEFAVQFYSVPLVLIVFCGFFGFLYVHCVN